ncbi:GGDEF domain-containing protein, partial [Nostoc sp. CHAB 5824]|nr:GGDEF domain-containing protein [Nostoc sp. CHAB 5824]
ESLNQTLRRFDILTRYSDDAFTVILPCTGEYAPLVASRVEEAVAGSIRKQGVHWGRTSLAVACGWAVSPSEYRQATELTQKAQERCREAQEMPQLKAA